MSGSWVERSTMDPNYDPPSASMNPKGSQVAMTPIKCFVLVGLDIYTVDWADKRELQCRGATPESALWVIESLALRHGKTWDQEDPEDDSEGDVIQIPTVEVLPD